MATDTRWIQRYSNYHKACTLLTELTKEREFDSLSVIGATALVRLTNAAIDTGKMVTKALTIDPVKTGFDEYETKMGSIQTILTNTKSKGTTLDDVIQALDTLNVYADKTIYNFKEMTRNIGTFTAAGIGLEDAVSSIQGIANLAAASGSTSQQASTAMYQLSQALASGTVKLMDWNSVVNAGMGGELFQEALKETAIKNATLPRMRGQEITEQRIFTLRKQTDGCMFTFQTERTKRLTLYALRNLLNRKQYS